MAEVPQAELGELLTKAIAGGVAQSVTRVLTGMPELFGTSTAVPAAQSKTIRGVMAQSELDAVEAMLKTESPGWLSDRFGDACNIFEVLLTDLIGKEAVQDALAAGEWADPGTWRRITQILTGYAGKEIKKWFASTAEAKHFGVSEVWARCVKDYTASAALGAAAHGLSALMSTRVAGFLGLNMAGVAALVGKFAGFDSMTSAVQGEFYTAYLKTPLHYWFNQQLTPFMPPIADMQRFRVKRIDRPRPPSAEAGAPAGAREIEDLVGYTPPGTRGPSIYRPQLPDTSEPDETADKPTPAAKAGHFRTKRSDTGLTFADAMAYAGYSKPWQDIYENDMYVEPSVRDLLLMIETSRFDSSWTTHKLERLGYADDDIPPMLGALNRRGARTQIMDLYRRIWYAVERGYMTVEQFRTEAQVCKFTPEALDYGADSAEWGAFLREADEYVRTVREQYAKAQLTDDEFRNLLDAVYTNPARVDNVVRLESAKRYRRVYLTTPTEDARSDLGKWRQLYVAGRCTEGEYVWHMMECGFEPDTVQLNLSVDQLKRERQVLSQFRSYRLPALRDKFLHGLVTIEQYAAELKAAGFPEEFLPDELALVQAKFTARQEGRVRTEQLAAYKRAYVLGLVGAAGLRSVMEATGISGAGVIDQMRILNYQRRELERRETERRAQQEIPVEQEAKVNIEAIERELARRRAKAMGLTEQWARLKSQEGRDQVRPIGDQLVAEIRKGDAADAGLVQSLSKDLESALWWVRVAEA